MMDVYVLKLTGRKQKPSRDFSLFFRNTYVGFHNVNNNNLLDLVQTIQDVWDPGVVGVSDGVMSVIKDYCRPSPPLLSGYSLDIQQNKFLKLSSLKYKQEEDSELYKYKHQDSLFRALVACLTKAEYKLGMDVSFDSSSRIFFFMKTQELKVNKEIKLPNMIGAGLGEKEDLAVYRPLLKRQKSSFLRSFRSKPNVTKLRREVKASLRRKAWVYIGTPSLLPHLLLLLLPTSYTLLNTSFSLFLLPLRLVCFGMVWYGLVWFGMGGRCQMTNEFLCEEISMLFHSEKFNGWWWWVGDIAITATSSRSRSL